MSIFKDKDVVQIASLTAEQRAALFSVEGVPDGEDEAMLVEREEAAPTLGKPAKQ